MSIPKISGLQNMCPLSTNSKCFLILNHNNSIFVNFHLYCDITYVPKNIYYKIPIFLVCIVLIIILIITNINKLDKYYKEQNKYNVFF